MRGGTDGRTTGQSLAVWSPRQSEQHVPEPQLMWKPLIFCTSPRSTVSVAGEGLIGCQVVCAREEIRSVHHREKDESVAHSVGAVNGGERKLSRNDGRVFDAKLGVVRHDSLALSDVAVDQRARDHAGGNGQGTADRD